MKLFPALSAVLLACLVPPVAADEMYDVVIRNGIVYDGTGAPPRKVDVAVREDRVAALLPAGAPVRARRTVDARGQAVAPGFINMFSWSVYSLITDGRGMSDVKQGVTLEVFGEGTSMGPLNAALREGVESRQPYGAFDVEWTTLGEYLEYLVRRGVTPNVASFVGATTVRIHELGVSDVQPDAEQLANMQEIVREAMRDGALGVGAALIYPPGLYAQTSELIALAQAAAEFGGGYAAHMRSEADKLLEAIDETLQIGRETGARVEVYHLKAAGAENWPKMKEAIARIELAQSEGLDVGANMYPYTAGATGLLAALPPWARVGGGEAVVERLKNPEMRKRVIHEMKVVDGGWENLRLLAGPADGVRLLGFQTQELKPLTGKTLAEVAEMRGTSVEDAVIDLLIEDGASVFAAYFLMTEENVELGLDQPWVSIGSDADATAPEPPFLQSSTHPRGYGSFARFLGHYVRDRKLMPLEEGIHRLTGLPARTWKLVDRGCLAPGCFADLVIFDPEQIRANATYDEPRQYATGVDSVFVNGAQVLRNGEHTGATPGRVVRGPGWRGWASRE